MTNYEKIKNMSVEEMADEMDYYINDRVATDTYQCSAAICPAYYSCTGDLSCRDTFIKWLESEAAE